MPKSILILGGTGDARLLANELIERFGDGLKVITSLAGRTSSPRQPSGDIREGGFGGAEGLAQYLEQSEIDAIIDATHPYAAQITLHAIEASKSTAKPHILLDRPGWISEPDDHWTLVSDMTSAARALGQAKKALITTGVQNLDAYLDVQGPNLLVRLLEHPKTALPLKQAEVVIGCPPYRLDDEIALFKLLGIDTLVTKNAGGDATRAKIDAARELGIHVIMIDRPATPTCEAVKNVDQAIDWATKVLGLSAH